MSDLAPEEQVDRKSKEILEEMRVMLQSYNAINKFDPTTQLVIGFFVRKIARLEIESKMFTDACG